ncbi:hypothetical protein OS493_032809 [Desmophyllum pertusum]|uniref:Uncharacterized protein n=1 Tax=Desmophyllum pertusum TaxID=174260 RepID=A0A9W9Z8H5_9CNID|nr:hypothetical protein OS493_032809 [Desmophyllum pertusum]
MKLKTGLEIQTLNQRTHSTAFSHSNSIPEDENDTATCSLKNGENGDVTDIDVCDIRQESMSSTELAESPDGLCEQPVDLSTHFKTISLGGDSSRISFTKEKPSCIICHISKISCRLAEDVCSKENSPCSEWFNFSQKIRCRT